MGHINLAAPWPTFGTSKVPQQAFSPHERCPKALSSVVYFAKYLVLSVDKDERSKVIESLGLRHAGDILKIEETIKAEMEKVKTGLGEKPTERQTQSAKKAIESLRESLVLDKDSLTEIYKTLTTMAKRIVPGAVLAEDEYLKLDEYDAISHLKVGIGAEAILAYLETIDVQKLSNEIKLELKEKCQPRAPNLGNLKVVNGLKNAGLALPGWFLKFFPFSSELRPMVSSPAVLRLL